jgi:hypothetical protein
MDQGLNKLYHVIVSRTIVPEPNRGAPEYYRCSECGWQFALNRTTFVVEYFDERGAQNSFRIHDCADFPVLKTDED